jgi:hypothetical protein
VIGEVGNTDVPKDEFTKTVQTNANNNTFIAPPKTGNSAFYRGYTDGYEGKEFNNTFKGRDRINYDEGYMKGEQDAEWAEGPRYQFVNMTSQAPTTNGSWPLPKGYK